MTKNPQDPPASPPDDSLEDRTVQFSPDLMPALKYRVGRFVVRTSGGQRFEQTIDLPLVRIGASPKNDLTIVDSSVSRFHCELRHTADGFLLTDLGSTNGTVVGALKVKEALVQDEAVLQLGRATVRFVPGKKEARVDASKALKFGKLVGRSQGMREIFGILEKLAGTDLGVLVQGETGTGKDLVARAVHEAGPRADGPFVVFDAGAVSPNLIESELFGHERGAFTGATEQRRGAFEQANGGTLFMDEIGELALELQPKLLRALEQREIQRVGGSKRIPVDVRVVCATNRNLADEVKAGRFRDDLFFRLSVVVLVLPPLRDRREDIELLVQAFLKARSGTAAATPVQEASKECVSALMKYDWPGNVRELRNVIEAARALCSGPVLEPRDLLIARDDAVPGVEGDIDGADEPGDAMSLAGKTLESIERAAIAQTLAKVDGNRSAAARALGIAPSTLYLKLKKYEIS